MCEQAALNKRKDMRKEVYDMKVLEIIMPVLVMILLGIWCRKKNVLTQSGIDNACGYFPCAGNSRIYRENRYTGRNHVCDAADFFFGWIFTKAIIGSTI